MRGKKIEKVRVGQTNKMNHDELRKKQKSDQWGPACDGRRRVVCPNSLIKTSE